MGTNDLEGNEVKHLELIQAVINRMGANSFAVKAWAVGLIAATFALAVEKGSRPLLVLVALFPVAVFWWLDSFYLRQERLFRRLYDAVRQRDERAKRSGPFGMSTELWDDEVRFFAVAWSSTIRNLYLLLGAVVLGVFGLLYYGG